MNGAIRDGLIVAWRNLKRIPRIPELAIFAILQSIMFVLLFAVVFGGAIVLPGYPDPNAYREFLMPGIFAQNIVFAAGITAIGMTDDVGKGIIDRFRSLPMSRSAVLSGRSLSDVVYMAGILIVLMVSGLFVGWTVRTGLSGLLAGFGLCLLFAFAMSWLGIFLGLNVPTVEVANQVIFTVLFPITFLSNAFVATGHAPDLAAAGRGVEPDVHADQLPAPAVGQSERAGHRQHPLAVPDPGDPRAGSSSSWPCSRRWACASTRT